MRIERADASLWEYAERYLGVGTRRYSSFSEDAHIDDRYHPQRGLPQFDLRSFRMPREAGTFLTNSIASGLPARYQTPDSFILPVHPATYDMLDDGTRKTLRGLEPGPRLTVSPSANMRTVFVKAMEGEPVEPHFLKLHFPARLSRFTRRLRQPMIRLQLWVAEELVRIGCPVLPEVGGGYVDSDSSDGWGYLIREARPVGVERPEFSVPIFALYGNDLNAPGDPTILEQLVERSVEPATDFVVDRVVRPMVRMWVRGTTEAGLALEMHGQNTVFGFSDDASDTVVLYRDGGVYIDPMIRAAQKLFRPLPPVNVISRDVTFPANQIRSLAYDSFMGHHALSFLARIAAERLDVRESDLHMAARDEFSQLMGERQLLPDTVFYYDNQLYPDGGWSLVDTAAKPLWR